MIRSLVSRLPVMITPRWVRSQSQPIAIDDVIAYLLKAMEPTPTGNSVYEIGGPERVSYEELMKEFARQHGIKRWILPVPFLTPGLSSKWLGLVTPLYARVGRKLIDGVRHDTVVHDLKARRDFPDIVPRSVAASTSLALRNDDSGGSTLVWSDPVSAGGEQSDFRTQTFGNRRIDVRVARVEAPPAEAFAPIQRIGGETGWYFADWLWRIRAFLDLMVGGIGMRRGRPHPTRVSVGQPLDFWRVEAFDPPRVLLLRAEMKVPGRAWLQFEVSEDPTGIGSIITQTAIFDPAGLRGSLYWYLLAPVHRFMVSGMISRLAELSKGT
jgi:hypothetical protein